jgi:C4-dicarboxylate-specific signal transduction histidine kinase
MVCSTPHGQRRNVGGAAPKDASTAWPGNLAELAASIAHEANQPLAAIVTEGDACLRWLADGEGNADEVRAGIEAMIKGALRTSNIIRGLCAFVTKDEPRRQALNLNELVEETVPLVTADVGRHNIVLTLDLASEPLIVLGEPVQLQQVVVNLLSNAIQAMASIEDRARHLRIHSQRSTNHAGIAIRDSGTGLDSDSVDRLFQGFRTTKADGTGVGLPICRAIVEAHGGLLCASPNVTHGATFYMALPLASASRVA